jgi:hypothetical protein
MLPMELKKELPKVLEILNSVEINFGQELGGVLPRSQRVVMLIFG